MHFCKKSATRREFITALAVLASTRVDKVVASIASPNKFSIPRAARPQ